MAISKFAQTTLISVVATLALSGATFAATADINQTGPGSDNYVTTETNNHVEVSNHNDVMVNNTNTQNATTGDARVSGNTTAGSAISGDAANTNSFNTTVSIGQSSAAPTSGENGGGTSKGGGSTSTNGSTPTSTAKGGGGASSVGGRLPETGASIPVDVSALRNLLNPTSQSTPLSGAVKANQAVSTVVLMVAAILSLLGAIGTAVYSTKRTLRV